MTPHKCAQCGAMIDPLLHECPYCRFTTPTGVAARTYQAQQAQWAAQAQYVQSAAARVRTTSTGGQALLFGILGIVLFCLPLGIVGIVQGFRARGMARALQMPIPGTATVGLVLSILSLFTSIGGVVLINQSVENDKAEAERHAAAIDARLGKRPLAPVLDHDVACGLVEAHLYREGYGSVSNFNVQGFECVGKLTQTSDRAEIDVVRMKDSTQKYEFRACLRRGERWYVSATTTVACPE